MEGLFILFMFLAGILLLISPFTLLVGLFKVFFQKEDKKFGVQLITYSTIAIIIGLGTCVSASFGLRL
ncbi:MAG TPA: hypothetical protein VJL37_01935 [Flavobacterium sp.]|nr:hypothetical protein [Flavobacterium sp.]